MSTTALRGGRGGAGPKVEYVPPQPVSMALLRVPGFSVPGRCPHCGDDAFYFFKDTKGVCHACFEQSDWPTP